MASTYTTNTGIELPGDGEKTGTWGQLTNTNMNIIDRALNGVLTMSLSGSTATLSTGQGGLSDGQHAVVVFTGLPVGAVTVTVSPDTAKKTYLLKNSTDQDVTMTQGSGGDVTIGPEKTALVFCTGQGSSSEVVDILPPPLVPATDSQLFSGTSQKFVDAAGVFSASAPVSLSDAPTIAVDFDTGFNFTVTLSADRILGNPTNQTVGQTGIIIVKQDGTGGRNLTYGSNWLFSNSEPTLAKSANAIDVIGYYVESVGTILCSFSRNFQ